MQDYMLVYCTGYSRRIHAVSLETAQAYARSETIILNSPVRVVDDKDEMRAIRRARINDWLHYAHDTKTPLSISHIVRKVRQAENS